MVLNGNHFLSANQRKMVRTSPFYETQNVQSSKREATETMKVKIPQQVVLRQHSLYVLAPGSLRGEGLPIYCSPSGGQKFLLSNCERQPDQFF